MYLDHPPGYESSIFYGVTDQPPKKRNMGIITELAEDFLDEVLKNSDPWCCFASITEPHDPFIAGQAAFDLYNPDELELPPNVYDDLQGRPGIYRKVARVWEGMTDKGKREAADCYYASITEIDAEFGRLIKKVEDAGQLDNTVVVFTSDHGELLGAHRLYCKNFTASEEVYNIPLIISGPGIAANSVTDARAGLHDLCPTLLELTGLEPLDMPDSRSFLPVLRDPEENEGDFSTGFSEYFGGRLIITQRVVWDGDWKYVFNGFDFDELYNLDNDPYEMKNLAEDPAYGDRIRKMTTQMWKKVRDTGDNSLLNSHYPILRVAPYGPLILEEEREIDFDQDIC